MFVEFRRQTSAPGHSDIGNPPETYDKRNGTSPRLPQSSQCQQVDRHLPGQKLDRWIGGCFWKMCCKKWGNFCPTFLDMVNFGWTFFCPSGVPCRFFRNLPSTWFTFNGIFLNFHTFWGRISGFRCIPFVVSYPPGQREVVGTFLCNGHAPAIAGFAGLCTWSDVCIWFGNTWFPLALLVYLYIHK